MSNPQAGKLSRREFLKWGGLFPMSVALSACGQTSTPTPPATEKTTDTVVPTSPPSPRPTDLPTLEEYQLVKGDRYYAEIPDTLDIHAHALLAINALTRCTNPHSNYDPYFYGDMRRNPPTLYRLMPFYGKFWEGLCLMRHLTGNSMNMHVDQHWRKLFLDWFQRDKPVLDGADGGRLLCWIADNFEFEGHPGWKQIGDQAVYFLSRALADQDDICFMKDDSGEMLTGWDATDRGWTLQGLARLYSTTGSSAAIELAGKLARYLKDFAGVFGNDGRFLARHPSDNGPALHFHHNGNAMCALSEYALAAGDMETGAFVQRGYEYARSVGDPLVGFFPEYISDWPDSRPYVDCETCCVADMIQMAINLSILGVGDYWDDADRFIRNQFIEMQMQYGDWITQIAGTYPDTLVKEDEDGDQISERTVGSFSGWALANDYIASEGEPFVSACCTGNGARTLAHVWKNIIEYRSGILRINLLLNRASAQADIDSHIPFEGRVDVKVKTDLKLEIRIPEWVKPGEVNGFINDEPVKIEYKGRYALLGGVKAGSKVVFIFPISERKIGTTIGNLPYTLIIKGNDVVDIQPPGTWSPLYQRGMYRENETHWTKRERFIPDE